MEVGQLERSWRLITTKIKKTNNYKTYINAITAVYIKQIHSLEKNNKVIIVFEEIIQIPTWNYVGKTNKFP